MLKKLHEILDDIQKREPVITDKGEVILSQAQIDVDCTNLKEIIERYAIYQA